MLITFISLNFDDDEQNHYHIHIIKISMNILECKYIFGIIGETVTTKMFIRGRIQVYLLLIIKYVDLSLHDAM